MPRIKEPSTFSDSDPGLYIFVVLVFNLQQCHQNIPTLPKYHSDTCQARYRFARCLRPCRRTRSRSRLRRVTRRPCRARCRTVGYPSPRACLRFGCRIAARRRRIRESSSSSISQTASGPRQCPFVCSRLAPSLLLLGTAGTEVGAVAEGRRRRRHCAASFSLANLFQAESGEACELRRTQSLRSGQRTDGGYRRPSCSCVVCS